jgi:hypothetical protein
MKSKPPKPMNPRGLSPRSMLVGLICIACFCFIVPYAELVLGYIRIGFLQLPPVVVVALFLMVVINHLLRRLHPRLQLNQHELSIIHCMMLVGCMVVSRGILHKLIPSLVAVNYHADQANDWANLFFLRIKQWLVPFNTSGQPKQSLVVDFYEGLDAGTPVPWSQWIRPLAIWSIPVMLVIFGFLCLATVIRRQWADNEKLPFPLVQLPLEFIQSQSGKSSFLRNRLMWLGFCIPVFIFTLNGLHEIAPAIPVLRLNGRFRSSERILQHFSVYWYFSFANLGFFYLLPVQLLFSLWFFFWLGRLQGVLASIMGWPIPAGDYTPGSLHGAYQAIGAGTALVAYFVFIGRHHIRQVLRNALSKTQDREASGDEVMTYRWAVFGLVMSFILTVSWCHYAGISWWFAAFQLFVYMGILAVILARCTAECGMLMVERPFRPMNVYRMFDSGNSLTASLGTSTLALLPIFDLVYMIDTRGLLLTGFLDSMKLSDSVGLRKRSLLVALIVAIVMAFVLGAVIQTWLPYRYGGNFMNHQPYRSFPRLAHSAYARYIEGYAPDLGLVPLKFFGIGTAVTTFLIIMRHLYWWWPLHPIGYALAFSWNLMAYWLSILAAWAIKFPLMRYAGVRSYRKARPFFLGLILGEFTMALLWTMLNWLADVPAPYFPWG